MADDEARARTLGGAAVLAAATLGIELPPLRLLSEWGPPLTVALPPSAASPWLLGAAAEALIGAAQRRSGGVHYTRPMVAGTVVEWALDGVSASRPVVCDPATGGGAFLLAAGEALAARGIPAPEVVGQCLTGVEVDPVSAAVTEAALALWCRGSAVPRVMVGDFLGLEVEAWPGPVPDAVIGNPPFLNQLGRATARSRATAAELRRRFGAAAGGYVDTAAVFMVMGCHLVRPGGKVALVLPQSFLATRDTGAARAAVLAEGALEVLWLPSRPVFGAAVRVCVAVVRRDGDRRAPVRHYRGVPPRLVAEVAVDADALATAPTWSHLVADGEGVPDCRLDGHGILGDCCTVTADFRQHYYGLAPFVVDDPDGDLDQARFPRLITAGAVDPVTCWWGMRPARFVQRSWVAPRVDLDRLEAETDLGPWAASRLVPKVVVATQTRVVEAVVDRDGSWLPSTPLVSLVASPERLWHVAAALLAPPLTAWALRRWAGSALSADALKLGATQIRELPAPHPGADWDDAAAAIRRASEQTDPEGRRHWLMRAAASSSRAYGVDDDQLQRWWAARLPPPRR